MKCILCPTVMRGAGGLLLGKHCACSTCIQAYNELEKAANVGSVQAARLMQIVQEKVAAYEEKPKETELTKALAHAEANWKD